MLIVYGGLLFHRYPTHTHISRCMGKMAKEKGEQVIILGLAYKTEKG